MSVQEQSIWTSNLENILSQLKEAYNNGLSDSPIKYFLDYNCSCYGCIELDDEVL